MQRHPTVLPTIYKLFAEVVCCITYVACYSSRQIVRPSTDDIYLLCMSFCLASFFKT
jgi:hypothetical protein